MSAVDDARNAINAAIDALIARRRTTSDTNEVAQINDSIDDLEAQRADLNEQDLAASASAVADATDAIEGAVKAAQAAPFDSYLQGLTDGINNLQAAQAKLFSPSHLPRTDDPGALPAPPAAANASGLPPVSPSRDPQQLASEYTACFTACVPDTTRIRTVQWYRDQVVTSRAVYDSVGKPLGIPWYFIGIIHGMESDFNFGTHLYNGDPLSARTVHVPAGRPPQGNPPFSWSDSATDALTFEHFANQADWTLPMVLFRLESYNGFGYRARGLRTPYLWSFSNLYVSGKYNADGSFDAGAVSNQCGAAVILKALVTRGILQLNAGNLDS